MTSTLIKLSRGVDFATRPHPVSLLLFLLIAALLSLGAAYPDRLLMPTLIKLSHGNDLQSVLFLFLLVDSRVGVLVFLGIRPLGASVDPIIDLLLINCIEDI